MSEDESVSSFEDADIIDCRAWKRERNTLAARPRWYAMLLTNTDSGEHTKVVVSSNPKREIADGWHCGVLCTCGSKEIATVVSKHLTTGVRGSMSKANVADQLARNYNIETYCDFDVIFKIEGAEQHIERVDELPDPKPEYGQMIPF